VAHGDTLKEIRDLNELVGEMKKTLESEYEKKMRLEEEKNRMQSIFGLYVDPSIVRGIMNNEFSIEQKGTLQEITVLFSDIRGYTSIAEKMLPRDVISFLNEYFTSMTEIILGHGGMIDKYIGDAIMCLFGAPLSNPEHRDLALQAAMDMQMTFELWVKNWEKSYGISPGMGIGLASGMAVVGNVGSFQKLSYTAVGDTVNLAARLESIAKPGAVLISEDIHVNLGPELREKYLFEGLEPVALKGKSGFYKTFSVSEKQS
jgi:class 3 adenylate cyclase